MRANTVSLTYAGPFTAHRTDFDRQPGLYMHGWSYFGRDILTGEIKRYRGGRLTLRGGARIARAVWMGCDGIYRLGRTDDMTQMLTDLGIEDRAR